MAPMLMPTVPAPFMGVVVKSMFEAASALASARPPTEAVLNARASVPPLAAGILFLILS